MSQEGQPVRETNVAEKSFSETLREMIEASDKRVAEERKASEIRFAEKRAASERRFAEEQKQNLNPLAISELRGQEVPQNLSVVPRHSVILPPPRPLAKVCRFLVISKKSLCTIKNRGGVAHEAPHTAHA